MKLEGAQTSRRPRPSSAPCMSPRIPLTVEEQRFAHAQPAQSTPPPTRQVCWLLLCKYSHFLKEPIYASGVKHLAQITRGGVFTTRGLEASVSGLPSAPVQDPLQNFPFLNDPVSICGSRVCGGPGSFRSYICWWTGWFCTLLQSNCQNPQNFAMFLNWPELSSQKMI